MPTGKKHITYDSTNQLVSAANAQTYALSITYGDWGKIQQYDLSQTDLANNTTTSQTRYYSYGSLNEGQTTFAPNNISYADGTNVNEQYGINGSLSRRETATPGNAPSEELYRFGADGNLRMYSYDRLFYSLYGYDGGTTRTYKYSFDLNPNWLNGRLESVNFNLHTAMFYPNAYINFNNNGHYTKHYYNGMERIASRLGDQNLPIHTHDPELQDRKDWQDSLIRKNVTEITGYEFLPLGQEQNPDDPKPVFELPVIGISNLLPSADGIFYYHPNHLGSTCYVTDENRSVVQGFLYAPFGEITNEHNSSFGNGVIPKYSFNAKELDEETGMYYYEARYYQPPTFTSRDILFEEKPWLTPYHYCSNNPIGRIDPSGMLDDGYLIIWAKKDGEYGHAGFAIDNYDENGNPDGTVTYYDLWPKESIKTLKKIPATYTHGKKMLRSDLSSYTCESKETHGPNGIIRFHTDQKTDIQTEKMFEKFMETNYYSSKNRNCSDMAKIGVLNSAKFDNQNSSVGLESFLFFSFTTPNALYEDSKKANNASIMLDAKDMTKIPFIQSGIIRSKRKKFLK